MLIKAERTGRKSFGDKIERSETTTTIAGVKITVVHMDTWSSGGHPGDGEYIGCTFLQCPKVDPWPNIREPKP